MLLIFLSGGATIELERVKASDVKLGMQKGQVFKIMGAPEKYLVWGDEERYSWQDVIVILENGKVVNKASFELNKRYEIQAEKGSAFNRSHIKFIDP